MQSHRVSFKNIEKELIGKTKTKKVEEIVKETRKIRKILWDKRKISY